MNIIVTIFLVLLPVFLLLVRRRGSSKRVPPGSLGFPIIGQSLGMLRAMRANTAEKWLEERVQKYGPVSKLSLFGKPTVFIYGQAANKRVRDALESFLKPDRLKLYVGKMEQEVRNHLETYWKDNRIIKVLPLMKTLTFNIICSLLFGLEDGAQRDQMVHYFQAMIEGFWSIPINLPFTRFNRSLEASKDIQKMLKQLISEKLHEFNNSASSHQDLITCLLGILGENNQEVLSENEIIHNVMLIMAAGYDTSSVLITFIVRVLAKNPNVHEAVLKGKTSLNFIPTRVALPFGFLNKIVENAEQEEIAHSKSFGESLTWEDLGKMKYTWRVAMETMRTFPPIFGGFRQTVKDIQYGGYVIPKGWQIFRIMAKTHMDSNIFQEPEKFDPSRFENTTSLPPYNFVPFGRGSRICPGYEFAKIETLVTIHYLVTHFTWKLCCTDDFFSRDPMPVPTQGLPIEIVPRKPL
ncbi:hypothetical protein T459_20786 [Capsicum annuum]|uniref:Cytochrome P450 716B1-like n=1 Tax=Capsicum annuum TaxID=4072 RepID=A0A2G2Z5M9_CAPAN|nr:hypothetical protein T459_20786 [Capsicum annuum]